MIEQELKKLSSDNEIKKNFPGLDFDSLDYHNLVKAMLRGEYPFFIQNQHELDEISDKFTSGKQKDRREIKTQVIDLFRKTYPDFYQNG